MRLVRATAASLRASFCLPSRTTLACRTKGVTKARCPTVCVCALPLSAHVVCSKMQHFTAVTLEAQSTNPICGGHKTTHDPGFGRSPEVVMNVTHRTLNIPIDQARCGVEGCHGQVAFQKGGMQPQMPCQILCLWQTKSQEHLKVSEKVPAPAKLLLSFLIFAMTSRRSTKAGPLVKLWSSCPF